MIVYTIREHGGAYEALKYARQKGKGIIHLCAISKREPGSIKQIHR